jgi:hypothetical protein
MSSTAGSRLRHSERGTRRAKRARSTASGQAAGRGAKFEAVMRAAESSGLLHDKSSRIGGRVSPALIEQARRQAGIESDTELIEYALASIALEDRFAEVFKESKGKVHPALKLGF